MIFYNKGYNKIKKAVDFAWFPACLFLFYFGLIVLIYIPDILSEVIPVANDGMQMLNLYFFRNISLANGEIPLWNPLLQNGTPYAADILMGAFYPLIYLICVLPLNWFFVVYYAIHIAFGAVYVFKYLKEIGCSNLSTLCTSFIYLFSIHLGGTRKEHILLIIAAIYLPVILFYIEKYCKLNMRKYLVIATIFMSLQFFSGFIQYIFYTDIVAGMYFLIRMFNKKIKLVNIVKTTFLWIFMYVALISIQLFPMLQLIYTYAKAGASGMRFESFTSLSIHPIKLLMMLMPQIFGEDVYQPLSELGTSGLDIELYFGSIVLAVIIFAIIKCRKNYYFKLSLGIMIGGFIYASNGCFTPLAKILYHIPLINSFRVPSRFLFVFIFFAYVVFAIGLNKIIEEFKGNTLFIILIGEVLLCALFLIISIIMVGLFNESGGGLLNFSGVMSRYMPTILALLLFIIGSYSIFFLYKSKRNINNDIAKIGLVLLLVVITLGEVLPYWKMQYTTKIEEESPLITSLKNDLANEKIWLAAPVIDAKYDDILYLNNNIPQNISGINCYISFNNPRLSKLLTNDNILSPSYNFSGLFLFFLDAKNNIKLDNDVLSMLGIKYIVDQDNLMNEKTGVYSNFHPQKTVLCEKNVKLSSDISQVVFQEQLKGLKSDTFYEVSFDINGVDEETQIICDFCGNNYDNAEQDTIFKLSPKNQHYSVFINTNEIPQDSEEILFRIISFGKLDLNIKNIAIQELAWEYSDKVYEQYYKDETMTIYENTNVKNILSVPENVVEINSMDSIYNNVRLYNFNTTSYTENIDSFVTAVTTIENINHTYNKINAVVKSEDETFINFSQNYYPGWEAYIDGKKTELYLVNGTIQGIKVPEGSHQIEFIFIPKIIYWGAGISIITFMFSIAFIIKKNRKSVSNR